MAWLLPDFHAEFSRILWGDRLMLHILLDYLYNLLPRFRHVPLLFYPEVLSRIPKTSRLVIYVLLAYFLHDLVFEFWYRPRLLYEAILSSIPGNGGLIFHFILEYLFYDVIPGIISFLHILFWIDGIFLSAKRVCGVQHRLLFLAGKVFLYFTLLICLIISGCLTIDTLNILTGRAEHDNCMLSPHPSKASMSEGFYSFYPRLLSSSLDFCTKLSKTQLDDLLTSPWFILAGDFIFHFLINRLDTPILHSYSTQVLQWSTTSPIPELIKFCILFPCYLLFYFFFRHIIILLLAIPFALCNYIYPRLPLRLRNHLSILSYRAPLNLFPPNEPALTLTPFTILNRSLSAITVLLRHPPLYRSFFVFPALFLVRGNNLWYLSQLDDECIPCTGLLLPGQMKYIVAYSLMPVFGWLMVRGIFGIQWERGMKDTVYDWWRGLRTSAWVSAHGTVVVTVVVVMRWGVLTVHHGLMGIAAPFVGSCIDGAHRGGI